ncbi:MAG: Gfo/Idh/MocA family oxidoreductase [Acidobacteriota bacterium]
MPRPIRWGLVGCGDIAEKRVVTAIQSAAHSELLACTRKNPDLLKEFQSRHSISRGYATYLELLADADIDAVYLATPVFLHCSQTIEAARHGKHVLCEKPMAMDATECRRMIEACRECRVRLGVAYYRRFYPVILKIRDLLADGGIGDPILARSTLVEHTSLQSSAWRFHPGQGGGGLLMDMASHRLDVLISLFGAVKSVSATVDTRKLPIPVEDTGSLLIRFANGVQALTFASHCIRHPMDDFEIFGTEGILRASPLNGPELQVVRGETEVLHLPKADNVHLPLVEDFNHAIRAECEPRAAGTDGMQTSLLLDAAYESARSGRVIRFD